MHAVNFSDVQSAASRIEGIIARTPVVSSTEIDKLAGRTQYTLHITLLILQESETKMARINVKKQDFHWYLANYTDTDVSFLFMLLHYSPILTPTVFLVT